MARKRVAILISGRGSNMAALIEAARDPAYPAEIALVLSNRPGAPGLSAAATAGVATFVLDHTGYSRREDFDRALDTRLSAEGIDFICLAGFMRILTPPFVDKWAGRILNIHPSLLPLFPGLGTHEKALGHGVRLHGCTVHFVQPAVDAGPIVAQAAVPVIDGDTPETLAARVLVAEHRIYPLALRLVASGEARLAGSKVSVAGIQAAGAMLVSPLPESR